MSPRQVVEEALVQGCASISYTYTEPTIFYEYARDCAQLASVSGLKNVFVTNGYMTAEALADIDGHLHAANVDLKSFSDDFYRTLVGARLKPVLDSIRRLHAMGVWVEVTTLLIPGHNDGEDELLRPGFVPGLALARHALARVSFFPSLPAPGRPPDPRGLVRAGPAGRARSGAALRVRGQRARARFGVDCVPRVRRGGHRAPRFWNGEKRDNQR